jgi:hypothetical protein
MAAHLWSGGAWRSMTEQPGDAAAGEIGSAPRVPALASRHETATLLIKTEGDRSG